MPTAGLGCRAASHVLSHSTPGGHLGVTAELMIRGEAPALQRSAQGHGGVKVMKWHGRINKPPWREKAFFYVLYVMCVLDAEQQCTELHKVAQLANSLTNLTKIPKHI